MRRAMLIGLACMCGGSVAWADLMTPSTYAQNVVGIDVTEPYQWRPTYENWSEDGYQSVLLYGEKYGNYWWFKVHMARQVGGNPRVYDVGGYTRLTSAAGLAGAMGDCGVGWRDLLEFDTDGDGVSDGWEAEGDGDPYDAAVQPEDDEPDIYETDTDGDGISDYMEGLCGTDPDDATSTPTDTDGDGTPDSQDLYPEDAAYHIDPEALSNYNNMDPDGDIDGDGILNGADDDADGDGVRNEDELAFGSDPTSSGNCLIDSDGDGASDAWELFAGTGVANPDSYPFAGNGIGNTTYPDYASAWADSDSDGVPNYLEVYYGADPDDALSTPVDSDYDGWPDAAEDEYGSDPNNSYSSPPTGFDAETGSAEWVPDPNYDPEDSPYEEEPENEYEDPGEDEEEPDPVEDTDPDPVDDADPTTLTADDVAKAAQSAIQASRGSIADAVAAGTWDAMQSMDQEVAEGMYNAMGAMETAVGRAIENTVGEMEFGSGGFDTEDFADAVTEGAGQVISGGNGPTENGASVVGDGGEGVGGVITGVGYGSVVSELTPDAQEDFTVTWAMPTEFMGQELTEGGEWTVELSLLPDTSTEVGQRVDTVRQVIRAVLSLLCLAWFVRALIRLAFNIT